MLPPSLALLVLHALPVPAAVPAVPFRDCAQSRPSAISFSSVYAQITHTPRGHFLNMTLLGQAASQILDLSNVTNLLSTVFAPTTALSFLLNPDDKSQFCATIRPPSPLPTLQPPATNYCPLPPGPFAFALGTRLSRSYELLSLNTRIHIVDTSSPPQELACLQLAVTPLRPGILHSIYGHAVIVFWVSIALVIAYWLLVGIARLTAARNRGRQRVHTSVWSRVQGMGFVLASAISGERFASSPALIRFTTPSMRDVIFHTQWCTLLGMVAVQWPRFAYPYFAQTAWATLLYNITLIPSTKHWYPLHADPFNPPSNFADQLVDPSSPLFINDSIPNAFFSLPPDIPQTGIPALAAAVGVRPEHIFGNTVSLFLLIVAGTISLSFLIFAIDWLVASLERTSDRRKDIASTPPWSPTAKEYADSSEPARGAAEGDSNSGKVRFLRRPISRSLRPVLSAQSRGWLSHRLGQSSFHGSVLSGNLVRVLILFHFPVAVFSCFQFSNGRAHSSLLSMVLAALAFAFFAIVFPVILVVRLSTMPTSKLYDETSTLLALGPLYNHYAHGSQLFASLFFTTNIVYALALGAGQRSGTAQALIILVFEVAAALTTSVWLPWARGATMGGISFVHCVARIITAVLLVILSPIVSVGDDAAGWIAYAILFIQGLVYLGFIVMLCSKLVEGIIRVLYGVSFGRSKHTVHTGLLGAIALAARQAIGRRKVHQRAALSDGTSQNTLPFLPAVSPTPAAASRTTVSGPPSVLRPEQLTQPYHEESDDDEGGFILGAWHHYDDEDGPISPPPSSLPVPSSPSPVPPPSRSAAASAATNIGFSRVAGGRAHIDSPYKMALPPGAMAPARPAVAHGGVTPPSPSSSLSRPTSSASPSPPPLSSTSPPAAGRGKGRPWFGGLFGARAGGAREATPLLEPPSSQGSSFVVIRERRRSPLSQSVSAADAAGDAGGGGTPAPQSVSQPPT